MLDGKFVVWDAEESRLSFQAMRRGAPARARSAPALAARWSALFVAQNQVKQQRARLPNSLSVTPPGHEHVSADEPRHLNMRAYQSHDRVPPALVASELSRVVADGGRTWS